MTDFTLSRTIDAPFTETVERVRAALGDAGFGVLTEIDLAATLHTKLGVEMPAQVILGACRPQLAHQALQLDPRVATMLPCNVVVGDAGEGCTRVEVFDPQAMMGFSADLEEVARDAQERLEGMLAALA